MALVVSMGWILLGGIILLYKFGKYKLGGSIPATCSCFLWPALVLGLVALVGYTDFGGIVIWGGVLGVFPAILISIPSAKQSDGESIFYGLVAFATCTGVYSLSVATGFFLFKSALDELFTYLFIMFGSIAVAYWFVYIVLMLLGYRMFSK